MSEKETIAESRIRIMLKLQADIRMMLIRKGVAGDTLDFAAEIFHTVMESGIVDEEFEKQYSDLDTHTY